MNETEIRNRLQDLAQDAPKGLMAPPRLLRRARGRIAFTVASSLVILLGLVIVGIAGVRALGSSDGRPAIQPTVSPSPDLFAGSHGWIAYQDRDGSELIAVNPDDPNDTISLGPSHGLAPMASSQDGSRLLLNGRKDDDLYVVDTDGSRIRLTPPGTSGWSGSFSPDGEKVVYAGNHDLYVVDSTGGTPQLLAASGDQTVFLSDPTWSPDGSRIAFIELTTVGQTSWGEPIYRRALSIVNADGTGQRVLRDLGREDRSPTGWATGLVWSPDGSRFAFSSSSPKPSVAYQIYVVNADGSELRRLTDGGFNFTPVWSPHSSRIAFVCGWGLCTISADGTDLREISGATPMRWLGIVWARSLDPLT